MNLVASVELLLMAPVRVASFPEMNVLYLLGNVDIRFTW